MNFITHRDHKLMRRVNGWYPPRWVRLWALWATRAGDGWLWYVVAAVVLLFGGPQRFLAVGCAALAAGAGIVLFLNVKKPIGPPAAKLFPGALLGHAFAAGPVFISFGPHHHCVRGGRDLPSVLPRTDRSAAVLRGEHCGLADPAGHALSE